MVGRRRGGVGRLGYARQRARHRRTAGDLEVTAIAVDLVGAAIAIVLIMGAEFGRKHLMHAAIDAGARRHHGNVAGDILGHLVLLLPAMIEHGIGDILVELVGRTLAGRIERERS